MTVTAFLIAQVRVLAEKYDVTVIVNTDNIDFLKKWGLDVRVVPVAIVRDIHPVADLLALFRLIRVFRKERFDLLHSITPKAGLLAMLAGRIAGVALRIHTFTGQVWATRTGFSRQLLKIMDRLLAVSATHLLADSHSQRCFLIDHGIASAQKITVLADGSISGVDTGCFRPDDMARKTVRSQLKISDHEVLLLFLGRLNRDKGILDLAKSFAGLSKQLPDAHLLLVGPDEGHIKADAQNITVACAKHVHFIDYTDHPEQYFAAADIFCLPSYREGFGTVIIEAAACGIPAIGSNIYGVCDAIQDGKTGLLFPVGDTATLAATIRKMVMQPQLRLQMGAAALERTKNDFSHQRLVRAWLDYYDGLQ